jgi:hypothetical protein
MCMARRSRIVTDCNRCNRLCIWGIRDSVITWKRNGDDLIYCPYASKPTPGSKFELVNCPSWKVA